MPTQHVTARSALELQRIADDLGKSRKVVVVTGAGISTNCGIPDFRSEDGLYSMIQTQYDAALLNPPWEHENTFDIDDRPKKKRKQWYYEVVAPNGQVVDVIDDEVQPLNSTTSRDSEQEPTRPSSDSRSTNTTSSNSRASSPVELSDVSSLSSCPSFTPEPEAVSEVLEGKSAEVADSPRRSSRRKLPSGPPTTIPDDGVRIEIDRSIIVSSPPRTLQQEESSTSSATINTQSSQNSRTLPNLKGRDLFDSMVWSDAFTTSVFYMFISSLRERILEVKEVSETHKFLQVLRDGGRLVRNYTQNIDMLEQVAGLSGDISHGPGNRSTKAKKLSGVGSDTDHSRGCESVPLHGTLARLRCNICAKLSDWNAEERDVATLGGTAPDCPFCVEANAKRTSNGRRGLAVGRLRPDIVLYGEEHPHASLIGPLVTNDLGLALDIVLIMGTSLKVHGLKVMLREFAKAVHARGGKVIFINRTKPPESTWGDVIDYWIECDCDEWVLDLKERRPDIWGLPPRPSTTKVPERRVSVVHTTSIPRKRPQAVRDDKTNGVFITFKILDTLAKVKDQDGVPSTRAPYWPSTNRYSNASIIEVEPEPVKKPRAKKRVSRAPAKSISKPAAMKIELPKRHSLPLELGKKINNQAYMVSDMWQKLREKAPGLPALPPELRQPFKELPANLPSYLTPFEFGAFNHFPNLGGGKKEWPLEKMGMDLIHLPPNGLTIPMHTPKNMKTIVSRAINHSYGTRGSARSSTLETIVVDSGPAPSPLGLSPLLPPLSHVSTSIEAEDTIVVDDPLTPSSSRIKRLSSIGNMVSSPEEGAEIWHDAPEVMTEMKEG